MHCYTKAKSLFYLVMAANREMHIINQKLIFSADNEQ